MTINEQIRKFRLQKGLTLEQVAKLSNLTKGYLSKVERSKKAPPVSTLQTIAVALGADITEFFKASPGDVGESRNLDILRQADAKHGEQEVVSRAGYVYHPLVSSFKNKYMSPFLLNIDKGKTDSFSHDSEEFVYVLEGTIELQYEGQSHFFKKGDSFYLDSRNKHCFVNGRRKRAVLLTVNFGYRRF